MNSIYFDNAATTQMDPAALAAWREAAEAGPGNPASLHRFGLRASVRLETARETLAALLGASAREIIFTSGGTESNSLALLGYCQAQRATRSGRHVIVSAIEHPSVLEAARWLATNGFTISHLPVDAQGLAQPAALRALLRPDTILVSVMHANNEVGTVQDVTALGEIAHGAGAAFHVDACQSFTKIPIDLRQLPVDLLTLSGHKIHGPKGAAALFVRTGIKLEPLFRGGGQEEGLRSGTPSVECIAAFAAAAEAGCRQDFAPVRALRDELRASLREEFPEVELNGHPERALPNIVHFSVPGRDAKMLLHFLDARGVALSAGSACSAGKTTASHVLTAMGKDFARASQTVRVSLSRWNTQAEVRELLSLLREGLRREPRGSA